jgi:hypothetical protein
VENNHGIATHCRCHSQCEIPLAPIDPLNNRGGARKRPTPKAPTNQEPVWVRPEGVVIKELQGVQHTVCVERQEALQCGAHALHALLGRAVARPHTRYLYNHLRNTQTPTHWGGDDLLHYQPSGYYTVRAINHWLYKHTTTPAMLMHVLTCNIQGRHVPYSRYEVLDKAPQGCRAFFVHVNDHNGHYKTWIQAIDGQWYECDSMHCTANTTGVRLLTELDWRNFTGTLYCLVSLDGYEHNSTLIQKRRGPPIGEAASAPWLDGLSLTVHTQVMRRVPRPQTSTPTVGVAPRGCTPRTATPCEPPTLAKGNKAVDNHQKTKKRPTTNMTGRPEEPQHPSKPPHKNTDPSSRSTPAVEPPQQPPQPAKPRHNKRKAKAKREAQLLQPITNFFQPQPQRTSEKAASHPAETPTTPPRYKPPHAPATGAENDVIGPPAKLAVTTLNVQGLQTGKMNNNNSLLVSHTFRHRHRASLRRKL